MEQTKEQEVCTAHEECNCQGDCQCNEQEKCSDDCTCHQQDVTCHCQEDDTLEETVKDKKNKKKLLGGKETEKLKKRITELETANQELLAKVQYSQAELINYRKRKEEETASRLKFANQDLINELLPLLDNFERAIKLDDNDLTDELSKFLQGFKMMYASFNDLLAKFGVEEIECQNQPFNPIEMQALMTDSDPNFADEEVLEVLLKGYKLKGRVLRAASVKVNKLSNEGEDKHE